MVFDKAKYKKKLEPFLKEYGRVEPYQKRRPLTANLDLRVEYKECLVNTYNDVINYLRDCNSGSSLEDKICIQSEAAAVLAKLKRAFSNLKLNYTFDKHIFEEIDFDKITEESDNSDDNSSESSATKTTNDNITPLNTNTTVDDNLGASGGSLKTNTPLDTNPSDKSTTVDDNLGASGGISETNTPPDTTPPHTNTTINDNLGVPNGSTTTNTPINNNSSPNNTSNQTPIMTQTSRDFIAMANQMINYRFSGDPLALDSFIDAVELLKDLCEANNLTIFRKFLMTRLEGVAREAIVTEPETVDDITRQLRASIKTESAKVIEGRILALRADKTNLTKFSERAEELAEQYRRSLCVEGFSKEKAKELAIEKTVEMCRKSARSDTVKAVIAATKFSEPKEVIAKMIIEIGHLKQDRPSSQYTHKNGNYNKNGNNYNTNKHHNKNSNNNSQNNSYNNRNNNKSGQQNGNNYNKNWHNNNNNNRNGQNNSSNNNSRTYYSNNNNRRNNEQSVRLISGNEFYPGNGGQNSDHSQN